ncbi:MAG: twin-arginine translocation signal domain-containing protein [Candidatus Hydrogenedentota bacterium]
MSKTDDQNSGLSRRDLLKSAAAAGMAFTSGAQIPTGVVGSAPTGDNRITRENA